MRGSGEDLEGFADDAVHVGELLVFHALAVDLRGVDGGHAVDRGVEFVERVVAEALKVLA